MWEQDKREEERVSLRFSIQYEKLLEDGRFGIAVTSPVRDFGSQGISFYSQEKIDLNFRLRITLSISDKDKVSFMGRVVRIVMGEGPGMNYIIGVKIETLGEEERAKINQFLHRVEIHNILERINLENVIDIHFVAGYPPIVKKMGKLVVEEGESFDSYTLKTLLLSMLDEDRYRRFMMDKELNFVFGHRGGTRFRVNFHIQQGKVEGIFRLIPSQIGSPTQLGLPPVVEKLLDNEKGLILVAGRTGSGKTTTLAAMIEFLNNKRDGIIICVEDPVEYLHSNNKCIIKQREVGRDTLSFSSAAKNALRQNPDVLLIGEILDMETMEVAITSAESGTLVLTSIHAADSSQALDRIISFFPPDMQKHILTRLSLIMRGVITQQLIPRVDIKGLLPAVEVLLINNPIKRVIREGDWKQIPTILQTAKNIGMQSMQDSLEQYYRDGLIDGEYLKQYLL